MRCLLDLALVRRPALGPNLSPGGLAWLAGTLFVCLIIFTYRQPPSKIEGGNDNPPMKSIQDGGQIMANRFNLEQTGLDKDSFVGATLAIICHLAIVIGLILIGWRHFQDIQAGLAVAVLYLLLPYYLLLPHMGLPVWFHLWPIALITWAVAAYRRPTIAGLLIGLATGTVYFPIVVFPVWLSLYWRRGVGRFCGTFVLSAGVFLAMSVTLLWLHDELAATFQSALALADWQPWRIPMANGLWHEVHWAYRIPVFIAYLAFAVATAFWPSPKNLAHVLALTAAVLIGIQFWYADRGGVHVLWYLPLLLLVVFRPNLSDRQPLPINSETDWLSRLGRWLVNRVNRLLQPLPPRMADVK